jgi:Lrp/AsnC family transcriptional regulator
MLDTMDIKILRILQEDTTLPVAEIGKKVGLSTTPCWRRIQRLEQDGVIEKRVALLNPAKVSAGVTVFVAITTNQHNTGWLERFHAVVKTFPEIVEAYRMAGQVDYLLRVVVPDIASYDKFYKAFIGQIDISDVSSSFAMEQIKYTTALPLGFAAKAAAKQPAVEA